MFNKVYTNQIGYPISKALQFVGDNSIYQYRRLFWISIMLISYSVLNSYLPLTLDGFQTSLFFFACGSGQLLCPMYLNIKTIVKWIIIVSFIVVISVNRIQIIQTASLVALGFLGRGLYVSSFIYINEIGGQKFRAWSFMVIFIVLGSAPFTLAIVQLLNIVDWLWIFIFVSIPHMYVYYMMKKYWHNSPLYYSQIKSDYKNVRQVIDLIAQQNKKPYFPYKIEGQSEEVQQIQNIKYTHLDLIIMPALKNITIPLAIVWFYRQVVYYGTFMVLPYLGQQNKNLMLLSVSQVVAAVMSIKIILHVKRINVFFVCSCGIIFSCILVSFFRIPNECIVSNGRCIQKYIYQFSAIFIRFFISLIGSILMNYTLEVFPTKVRKLAFGICLASASFGSFVMPLLIQILVNLNLSPFICLGVISGIAIYFILILPETHGKMTTVRLSQMQGYRQPILHINYLNIF